jgi:UDP-glucose:(heptosyl)LPS alpha-1,3-glucosyltransferase
MISFAKAVERHVRETAYEVVVGLGKTWSHDVIRLGGGCHQTFLHHTYNAAQGVSLGQFKGAWLRHRCALALEARGLAREAYSRVITNSAMVKRDVMARYGVPDEAITVIPNGVDLDRFHPRHRTGSGAALRQQLGFADGHLVLVFVGTGYRRKGLGRLLDVLPDLARQRPGIHLLVVGYESGLKFWQQQAEQIGMADRVRFLGGRRDPEACYGAGDLYVLPTQYDPFANTTLEALASGLPVVTTAANGGCEVLDDGQHGAVMPDADDREALLQALLMWSDRERLRDCSVAARSRAEQYGVRREMEASTAVLAACGR